MSGEEAAGSVPAALRKLYGAEVGAISFAFLSSGVRQALDMAMRPSDGSSAVVSPIGSEDFHVLPAVMLETVLVNGKISFRFIHGSGGHDPDGELWPGEASRMPYKD